MARWISRAINLSVLGVVLFVIFGGMFQRWRFFADVQHRQAMGDKALVSDFVTTAPPDDQNAAIYILKAIGQLQLNPHQRWLIDDAEDYRLSDEAKSFVIHYRDAHPNIMTLVQDAEACPQVDWHLKWRSPALDVELNSHYLDHQRDFARFLYAVAICQHEAGDDEAAMHTLRDIFFLARAVDTRSTFIGHLSANGLRMMGANLYLRVADPQAAPKAGLKQNFGAVARPAIAELCDDARFRKQLDDALRLERMVSVDSIVHFPVSKFGAFCYQYPIYSGAHALLDEFDAPIRASGLRSWPAASALVPSERPQSLPFLAKVMDPPLWKPFLLEYECEAERHAAAIAIACRLYADDHSGNWPPDLSALVPHYLPAIPCDPFDAQLRPMKYLPVDPPAIYSISTDGIDNHGDRTGAVSYKYGFEYDPWKSPDAVFPIGGVVEPAEKRPPENADQ